MWLVFSLLTVFLFSCAKVDNWDRYYVYSAQKGWKKEDYERKVLPKPPRREEREEPHEKEKKEKILKLLRTPPTPVKAPDTVLRILVLPWVDKEGTLHASQYIFVEVENGKWILGEYLLEKGRGIKLLTPLEEKR